MRRRSTTLLSLLLSLFPVAIRAQAQEAFAGTIAVAGSVHGNFGSDFKTSVQLVNPSGGRLSGHLVFTPAGIAGTPVSVPWNLEGNQSLSFEDVVTSMGQSGLGTLDVFFVGAIRDFCNQIPYSGGPVVIARVYNDAGDAGTAGASIPIVPYPGGQDRVSIGILAGPSSRDRFRFNVGLRTFNSDLFDSMHVSITVWDAQGNAVKILDRDYPENSFFQTDVTEFLDGFEIGENSSIMIQTSGPILVYGATVDNTTNSPTIQIMPIVLSGG